MSDFDALFPSLLSAVYGHVQGDITLFCADDDGVTEDVSTSALAPMLIFVKSALHHVWADCGASAIVMVFRDEARAQGVTKRLKPAAVVKGQGVTRLVYAIEGSPAQILEMIEVLNEGEDDDFYSSAEFPVPYGPFTAEVDKKEPLYTIEEFEAAMFAAGPDDEPNGSDASELSADLDAGPASTMNDAEVYGDIPKAILDKMVRVSVGREQSEKVWTTSPETPFGLFLDSYLTRHKAGKKDGPCFVTGAVADKRRTKNSVTHLYMLGLDVDSGASLSETFHTVRTMGLFAVFYTTHSHGTTELRIKQDKFYKWAQQNAFDPDPSDELVKKYLTDEDKYTADVISTATFIEEVHDSTGMHLIIRTRPIDKFRIVFLLDEPYVMAAQKMAQRDAISQWEGLVLGMGAMLGISVDRAARDPSRLFFYPRHEKGTTAFRILVSTGKALDWTKIKQLNPKEKVSSDPFDQAGSVMGGRMRGRTMSPTKGIDLQTWASERADGFMISKVFEDHCSDRLREETGPSKFTCECPFDDDHSNSGDPDDKGCYIEDAGINAETFSFKCRHDSCSGRDRLHLLEKAMTDGWFSDDVLTDNTYDCIDRTETEEVRDEESGETAEEPKHKETIATYNRAMEMANKLVSNSPSDDVSAILKAILPLGQFDRQRVIKQIEGKTKVGISQLNGLLKSMEANNPQQVQDTEYNAEKTAIDTKLRFATLRKEKRPVVISNEGEQPASVSDLVKKLSMVNVGRPQRTVKNRDGDEIIPAIEPVNALFRWGDTPVHIGKSADGFFLPQSIDKAIIRDVINQNIRLISLNDSSTYENILAPDWMAEQAIVSKDLEYLPLEGWATLPYFNKSRELVVKQGYDRYSEKILKIRDALYSKLTEAGQKIYKARPTAQDVDDALNELFGYCFYDFPFDDGPDSTSGGKASRAHLLCMMLQPLVRALIEGPTPLYMVDKPAAGTGASLLVSAAMTISLGYTPPTKALPDNEEEVRKSITAGYQMGEQVQFFDNVNHPLVSGFYANMATAPIWQDRMLGKSETISIKNTMLNIFGGNNIRMSEELARRSLMVRMDLKRDPTNALRAFRCKNLMEFVNENQLELFGCLLTLVNFWINNGARVWEGEPLASFENYCKIMGGILQDIDMPGFLENRSITANSNSVDRMAWVQFIRAMKVKLDKDRKPFISMGEIVGWYIGMTDAPTLVVNGGGRVTPHMDENRVYGAMQMVIDRQLGQVFTIMSESDDEIEVTLKRVIDRKESKTLYGIVMVEHAEEQAA